MSLSCVFFLEMYNFGFVKVFSISFVLCQTEIVGCSHLIVEHNGSEAELRILNYENPGSNPVLQC